MIRYRTPFFLPWLYPTLYWKVPTTTNTIYLTFDDGPIPEITEETLRILDKYNAKATFFCIGDNVVKHPDIFKKVVDANHKIGNHTFHHVSGWRTPTTQYKEEIDLADKAITAHLGYTPNLFRPPYGRITRKQIKDVSHKIVMWDVLSLDYSPSVSADQCLQGTIKATRPGSIVVFHDSIKASKNMLYALPRFLDTFSSKGFVFKTLDI